MICYNETVEVNQKGKIMEVKFYRCRHCGNIATKIIDSGVELVCCGEPMLELKAGTTDATVEKHVPEVKQNGNLVTVKVGSDPHPMEPDHYIEWIYLLTNRGEQFKRLTPDDQPQAEFALLDGEQVVAAYEWCNLHGLWQK